MKALTLHQPWASLISGGQKWIETRSWKTEYRGELAIHAAKDVRIPEDFFSRGLRQWHNPDPMDVERPVVEAMGCGWSWQAYDKATPCGVVVATCELYDVVPMYETDDGYETPCLEVDSMGLVLTLWGTPSYWEHESDETDVSNQAYYGDFRPGRWAWLLSDVKPLAEPIPVRGRQGLWNWEIPESMKGT